MEMFLIATLSYRLPLRRWTSYCMTKKKRMRKERRKMRKRKKRRRTTTNVLGSAESR
jgi:uncharacterized membrane protein